MIKKVELKSNDENSVLYPETLFEITNNAPMSPIINGGMSIGKDGYDLRLKAEKTNIKVDNNMTISSFSDHRISSNVEMKNSDIKWSSVIPSFKAFAKFPGFSSFGYIKPKNSNANDPQFRILAFFAVDSSVPPQRVIILCLKNNHDSQLEPGIDKIIPYLESEIADLGYIYVPMIATDSYLAGEQQ